jgi:phenylacetate-coenzyme A ligase PaaK-like adenylate-forming protein
VIPTLSTADRLRELAARQLERDGWSRDRLMDHQRRRSDDLLAHAAARSPYYADRLRPGAPLAAQPTLSKTTLMEQWDRVVCDPRLRLADVEAHAAGPDAGEPYLGEFQVFSTSGSSGLRGLFVYDTGDWATALASTARGAARCGMRPEMRTVGLGAPGGAHMSKRIYAALQSGRSDTPELSVLTALDEMVSVLNAYRPEVLMGYPSAAALLAAEQLAGRLDIAPRVFAFGSEPLPAQTRARIRDAWGADPVEYYASTEVPMLASSTPEAPRALEMYEDLAVIEVVDEDDRPVPPGTAGAKLLLTNLENRTLPLIRYEMPDRVTVSADPNPAGRPWRHIEAIDGRTADTLTFPARGGGEVAIHPLRLGAPFVGLPAVRQFQIVHDRDGLEVRVALQDGAPADTAERVRGAVLGVLDEAGAVAPPLQVTSVAQLEREPGAAAKLKLIVARE